MSTILPNNTENKSIKKNVFATIRMTIREILALMFWIYLVISILFFDIDNYLAQTVFSNCTWVIRYKFLVIISLVCIFWLFAKSSRVASWFFYILFYPFILLFWKIPSLAIKRKSWNFAFAIINSAISYFRNFKWNFLLGSIFLCASIILIKNTNKWLLWVSISFVLIYLFVCYIRKFIFVFSPSSIFRMHVKIFESIKKMGMKNSFTLTEDIKNLPVQSLNKEQLEKWTQSLQTSVLFNRLCLFFAKKLKNYQESGLNIASYVLSLLWLIILTVFSFSVLYYGCYKIYPEIFKIEDSHSFFTFFYFSFNNLLYNSISEVSPATPISQSLVMLQKFFSFFLVAIFISLFISVSQQKHTEELNKVIEGLHEEGKSMESFIQKEYNINDISAAIDQLGKLKAGFFNLIFQISNFIS